MSDKSDIRKIIIYGNYYWDFYNSRSNKVQKKIEFVLRAIRTVRFIPGQYFKHLEGTNGLYEIRVQAGNDIFRIFCCFDDGSLVILFNGFQKKTEKTPKHEIEKALLLKNQYYENKKQK